VLLRNLRPSLKQGARIGIIDRNGNETDHGMSKDVVVREAAQVGYELRDSQDFVKADGMDYFLIFTWQHPERPASKSGDLLKSYLRSGPKLEARCRKLCLYVAE